MQNASENVRETKQKNVEKTKEIADELHELQNEIVSIKQEPTKETVSEIAEEI
ncbi:hypothetical protein [Kordia periserrulae]|uniref:hypothetical protein n=1 Tax=Kordia periserrulae TaxID=701523 RepID=UPI001304E701|nr:hypothetical protein [Kordia periserrulae]